MRFRKLYFCLFILLNILLILLMLSAISCSSIKPIAEQKSRDSNLSAPKLVSLIDLIADLSDSRDTSANSKKYLFDKDDMLFLDIRQVEAQSTLQDFSFKIKLNGPAPTKTPNDYTSYEWAIYIDKDQNLLTGFTWPIVTNDIGADFSIILSLSDSIYTCQIKNLKSGKIIPTNFIINDNVIELHCPFEVLKTESFNFIVSAMKYNHHDSQVSLLLSDITPNTMHANFPVGVVVEVDQSIPAKLRTVIDRKFTSIRIPSRLFSVPIADLLSQMSGDCDEYAIPAAYWLEKSGYESYVLQVNFDKWWPQYNVYLRHDICVFKGKDGLWYSIDIYDIGSAGSLKPYKSIQAICDRLPSHYSAHNWTDYNLYTCRGELINHVKK